MKRIIEDQLDDLRKEKTTEIFSAIQKMTTQFTFELQTIAEEDEEEDSEDDSDVDSVISDDKPVAHLDDALKNIAKSFKSSVLGLQQDAWSDKQKKSYLGIILNQMNVVGSDECDINQFY